MEIDLSEAGDFPFKLRKMFACPVDPFKSALEWVERHDATLDKESAISSLREVRYERA